MKVALQSKFFGQVCIPRSNLAGNFVQKPHDHGDDVWEKKLHVAGNIWKNAPNLLTFADTKLSQSVSFLMVVTRQGCWTKHIHNYFGLAMPKCRHASYKIGRWKEAHLQKEETDSSQMTRSTKKAELKKHLQCLICNYVSQSLGMNLCVKNLSSESLVLSRSLLLNWVHQQNLLMLSFPPKRMAIMIPFYIINQVLRTIKRLERSSLNHNLYFFLRSHFLH